MLQRIQISSPNLPFDRNPEAMDSSRNWNIQWVRNTNTDSSTSGFTTSIASSGALV